MNFNKIKKVDVLGFKISDVTVNEATDIIIERAKEKISTCVFTPNSEIIENFRKDENLTKLLNEGDILTPDGIGVVIGAKILGTPLKGRCPGYDIACELLKRGSKENLSFYFFGSKEEVGIKAKENVLKKYPDLKIVGTHSGYFNENDDIASIINEADPDIVFVCLGAPKQEKWIHDSKDKLKGKVLMGLGGSLDVLAGTAKRAPDIFIKLNLEWLYRLIKQPTRFIRMLALPQFLIKVTAERIMKGKVK